ncbi:Uncharacterised protein [Salmonella enterica subsp. enterica serovar Typhi]|nr:Uncharacterised protein [Salmonella enterica subsp. enterica serovar Typhi]CHD26578.1 Uncharacterised protein [Salmonella enterica subsp. enterica serovar Typhi]CHL14541.1 Uncharacterised protein [Salmonella enterica subsp. enterica serovar Typhi]CHM06346.1 Uncharacterised protein [Salmonella enterica subsp. enterica serovar Typhi]CRF80768.1 Uncharacterised protein [Salmonella enterica subsp. enterica serovar Typhi]
MTNHKTHDLNQFGRTNFFNHVFNFGISFFAFFAHVFFPYVFKQVVFSMALLWRD